MKQIKVNERITLAQTGFNVFDVLSSSSGRENHLNWISWSAWAKELRKTKFITRWYDLWKIETFESEEKMFDPKIIPISPRILRT